MGKVLKWMGIGCGGLLGLLVIVILIVVLVSGGDSAEPEVSVAENVAAASSTEAPDGRERTNPLPRGYSITHSNLKVTIIDVSYSSSEGGLFSSLEENHVWAIVELRLEAVGDPNKAYWYRTSEFRLVGDRGIIYDESWITVPNNDIGSGEFFGGGVVEGNVVRQVHKDDTNLILIYSPALEGSRYLALESNP